MAQQIAPIVITNASAASGTFPLGPNHVLALHAAWPSGVVGTLRIQGTVNGVNWEDIPDSDVSLDGVAAGSQLWNYERAGFSIARVYFVYTSGAGTIQVHGEAKGG